MSRLSGTTTSTHPGGHGVLRIAISTIGHTSSHFQCIGQFRAGLLLEYIVRDTPCLSTALYLEFAVPSCRPRAKTWPKIDGTVFLMRELKNVAAMFEYFTFGTPSDVGTAGYDKDAQVCPKDDSSPSSLSPPESRRQTHDPSSAFDNTPNYATSIEPEPRWDRERLASIDIITHRLSNSHLRIDDSNHPPPLSRDSTLTCSSATSYSSPTAPKLETNRCYQKPLSSTACRRRMFSSISPAPDSSAASPLDDESVRSLPRPRQDPKRLRRQNSSKFHNDPQNSRAIQSLVEEMISTRTQCNVSTPPLLPTTPVEAADTNGMNYEVEVTGLEVDENYVDDAEDQTPFVDKLLTLRHASITTGIRKSGFPLHQSSTDTALRCQQLVRNKPRMRKRPRMRRQPPGLTTIPTGGAPSVGSSSAGI